MRDRRVAVRSIPFFRILCTDVRCSHATVRQRSASLRFAARADRPCWTIERYMRTFRRRPPRSQQREVGGARSGRLHRRCQQLCGPAASQLARQTYTARIENVDARPARKHVGRSSTPGTAKVAATLLFAPCPRADPFDAAARTVSVSSSSGLRQTLACASKMLSTNGRRRGSQRMRWKKRRRRKQRSATNCATLCSVTVTSVEARAELDDAMAASAVECNFRRARAAPCSPRKSAQGRRGHLGSHQRKRRRQQTRSQHSWGSLGRRAPMMLARRTTRRRGAVVRAHEPRVSRALRHVVSASDAVGQVIDRGRGI